MALIESSILGKLKPPAARIGVGVSSMMRVTVIVMGVYGTAGLSKIPMLFGN
ncbi:MAG: hypothetical protein FWC42_00150 [Proteobacteria bacterium]|nr:hypothetical protein [Pseudomonadota bacterium]